METRKRILVVDDQPGIVKLLSIKFSLSGYDVIATTRGTEAVELVRREKPDILLLDIMMPGTDGLAVLREVRGFSQVPTIIFTARGDIARFAKIMGANDSIAKPFDLDQLLGKVGALLDEDGGGGPAGP